MIGEIWEGHLMTLVGVAITCGQSMVTEFSITTPDEFMIQFGKMHNYRHLFNCCKVVDR